MSRHVTHLACMARIHVTGRRFWFLLGFGYLHQIKEYALTKLQRQRDEKGQREKERNRDRAKERQTETKKAREIEK